eukprot:6808548-Pyramimonas_sp.AAC.1
MNPAQCLSPPRSPLGRRRRPRPSSAAAPAATRENTSEEDRQRQSNAFEGPPGHSSALGPR